MRRFLEINNQLAGIVRKAFNPSQSLTALQQNQMAFSEAYCFSEWQTWVCIWPQGFFAHLQGISSCR